MSDHKIRLAPNFILIFPPLLENFLETSLITPPRPVNPLNSQFLTRFLESPPNSAIGAISPRRRAPRIHHTAAARSQGAAITFPTTLLPLLNPTSRILNNPPPPSPFSTTPRRTSPELTLVRRASSLLPNQPIKLVSSSPVFPRRIHRTKLPPLDRWLTTSLTPSDSASNIHVNYIYGNGTAPGTVGGSVVGPSHPESTVSRKSKKDKARSTLSTVTSASRPRSSPRLVAISS